VVSPPHILLVVNPEMYPPPRQNPQSGRNTFSVALRLVLGEVILLNDIRRETPKNDIIEQNGVPNACVGCGVVKAIAVGLRPTQ
jgi:hypothetical protein